MVESQAGLPEALRDTPPLCFICGQLAKYVASWDWAEVEIELCDDCLGEATAHGETREIFLAWLKREHPNILWNMLMESDNFQGKSKAILGPYQTRDFLMQLAFDLPSML